MTCLHTMQGNSAGVLDCDTPGIWGKRHVAAPRLFGNLFNMCKVPFGLHKMSWQSDWEAISGCQNEQCSTDTGDGGRSANAASGLICLDSPPVLFWSRAQTLQTHLDIQMLRRCHDKRPAASWLEFRGPQSHGSRVVRSVFAAGLKSLVTAQLLVVRY